MVMPVYAKAAGSGIPVVARSYLEEVRSLLDSPKNAKTELFSLLAMLDKAGFSENEYREVYGFVIALLPQILSERRWFTKLQPLLNLTPFFRDDQVRLALEIARQLSDSDPDSAIHYYTRAIAIDPLSKEAHRGASLLFFQKIRSFYIDRVDRLRRSGDLQQFQEAIEGIEKILHLIPDVNHLKDICRDVQEIMSEAQDSLADDYSRLLIELGMLRDRGLPDQLFVSQSYQTGLRQLRTRFTNPKIIFDEWSNFIKGTLIDDIFNILGPPPCGYDIRAMGSLGKKEPCPYSDLEYFILIENEKHRPYFTNLAKILELQVVLLGETAPSEALIFTALGSLNTSGFHIDTGGNPALDPNGLIVTPTQMAALQNESSEIPPPNSIELTSIHTSSLSSSGQELFGTYLGAKEDVLSETSRKTRAIHTLNHRVNDFKNLWKTPYHVGLQSINLKTQYTSLLNYLLTDLAFYFNIPYINRSELIRSLVSSELFTRSSGYILEKVTEGVYATRVRLHLNYGQQKEEASFPNVSSSLLPLTTSELTTLEQGYYLVLAPFYGWLENVLKGSKNRFETQFINIDLVTMAFKHFISDPTKLKQILPWVVESLHFADVDQKTHEGWYDRLGALQADDDCLRAIYLRELEKLQSPYAEALLERPDPYGLRRSYLQCQEKLRKAIRSISPRTTPQKDRRGIVVKLSIAGRTDYYLDPFYVEELIDSEGNINQAYPKSAHRVCSLPNNSLHFKQKPSQCLVEYGIHSLTSRFFGYLTPTVELARFEVEIRGKTISYPVLISETIKGHTLAQSSIDWKICDKTHLTQLLIATLLTRPGDGRSSNYVMNEDGKILCIDNDISFAEPVTQNVVRKKVVQFCSALFCLFPQFELDFEVMRQFCENDPLMILDSWLHELAIQEKIWVALFSSRERERLLEEKESCKINMVLAEGCVAQLDLQVLVLQRFFASVVEKHQRCNLTELLEQLISISPSNLSEIAVGKYVAAQYTAAMEEPTPDKRLARITSRDVTQSMRSIYSDAASFGKTPTFKEVEDRKKFSPQEARKELHRSTLHQDSSILVFKKMEDESAIHGHFKVDLTDTRQLWILREAAYRLSFEINKPKSITLRGCTVLDTMTLKPFLHPDLLYLDLRLCPEIRSGDIALIAEMCPNLEELYLSGCTKLDSIGRSALNLLRTPLEFPSLKTLQVASCPNLTQILIKAPVLNKCVLFKLIKLNRLELEVIDLTPRLEQSYPSQVVIKKIEDIQSWLIEADPKFRKSKNTLLEALKIDSGVVSCVDEELWKNVRFVIEAVKYNEKAFIYSDQKLWSDSEFASRAVLNNSLAFKHIPDFLKADKDFALRAVCQNASAFLYVDKSLKTKEFILEALSENSDVYSYLNGLFAADEDVLFLASENHKNREKLLPSLGKNGLLLRYASHDLKNDKEIVLTACKQNENAFLFADEILRTDRGFILAAVKQNGLVIRHLHQSFKRDKEIVIAATVQNGEAIQYADESIKKNRDVAIAILEQNGKALHYMDHDLINDPKVVSAAIAQAEWVFVYAGESLKKDKKFILNTIAHYPEVFKYADESLRLDQEFILEALARNASTFLYAHESVRDDRKFVLRVLFYYPTAYNFVDVSFRSKRSFVLEAVSINGFILGNVDESFRSDVEIVLRAIEKDAGAIIYVDQSLRRQKSFLLQAISKNGLVLQYLDDTLRGDRELALAAVHQDIITLEYVAQSLKDDPTFMSAVNQEKSRSTTKDHLGSLPDEE